MMDDLARCPDCGHLWNWHASSGCQGATGQIPVKCGCDGNAVPVDVPDDEPAGHAVEDVREALTGANPNAPPREIDFPASLFDHHAQNAAERARRKHGQGPR